ncbi:MAG: tetratricopeptide repeat protein [Eubacterium sp.]|nr:tetratricopeptide repeat protein [Eubacterium sp.]
MNIWNILEIEKTTNIDIITNAYRQKLVRVHPEEDPKGFMELRAAYEEALKIAQNGEEQKAEKTFGDDPVGQFMKRVDEIYSDFSQRKDIENWKELLEDDTAQMLDTKAILREELLVYFMEHFFIPKELPVLIGEHFNIAEDLGELENTFPREYLDEFASGQEGNGEIVPFEHIEFGEDEDVDEFFRTYVDARKAFFEKDFEKGEFLVGKLNQMSVFSPYVQYINARLYYYQDQSENALETMMILDEDERDIREFNYLLGDIYLDMGKVEEARECYNREGELHDAVIGRFGIAKCELEAGNYCEARDIILKEVSDEIQGPVVESVLQLSVEKYIEETEDKLSKGEIEEDQDLIINLAWSYYLAEQHEDVIKYLTAREYDSEHERSFINILGRSYFELKKYEEALPLIERWVKIEDREEQGQYSKMLLMRIYEELDMIDELNEFSQNLSEEDANSEMYKKLQVEKAIDGENYFYAIDLLNNLMEELDEPVEAKFFRGKCLYRLGFLGDAFDDMESVIAERPYELIAYMYKVEILVDAGEIEEAERVVEFLEEEIDIFTTRYLRARITEKKESFEKASEAYLNLLNEETDEEIPLEFYINGSSFYINRFLETENVELLNLAEKVVEKGLTEKPNDIALNTIKGDILTERNKHKKALEIYSAVAAKAPYKIGIYGKMDNSFRSLGMWEEALECATLQVQQAESGYSYMRRGQIYICMHRLDDALRDLEMARNLTPENPYVYNYEAVAYEFMGDFQRALELYTMAIKRGEMEGEVCKEAYINLGILLGKYGKIEDSIKALRDGYHATGDPELLVDMEEQYRREGLFEEALDVVEEYRIAKGLSRRDKNYRFEKAKIYFEMKDYNKAAKLYSKIIVGFPKACKNLAKLIFHSQMYDEAYNVINAAINMVEEGLSDSDGPDFLKADYYLWAAKIALKLNREDEAKAYAEKGLRFIPEKVDFRFNHCEALIYQSAGGLYVVSGDLEKAEECFNRVENVKMCDGCLFRGCIDLHFEKGNMYELLGEYEKALEEYEKGLEYAPYDSDLINCKENLMERIRR